jgi:UDP-glucose 4-epimerase
MIRKVLVTGGLGYIGSHTVVELLSKGIEVVIVDNLSNSEKLMLERIDAIANKRPRFYEVDMCNAHHLLGVFKVERKFDAVITLLNLLDCMEAFQCTNILFSSSATVYGEPDELPVRETTVFKKALSAYESTKQMGEEILEKVSQSGKLNVISLRYFNPVGAHHSALIGELPIGRPNNLVPIITRAGAGKINDFTVYGNDYPTPDGTCMRDYIHVVDLAKAHVKACEKLFEREVPASYEVYNIGTGAGHSVMEVIRQFEKESGNKLDYKIGEKRIGDAVEIYADVTKANRELRWKAEANLEDMIKSAWAWEKSLGSLK